MDDDGIINGTRWFLPNMRIVPTDSSNRPYSDGTAPSRLIIASRFTDSDTGTYVCSPNSTFPTEPSGDSITLIAAIGMYIYMQSCCCIIIYWQVDNHSQSSTHPANVHNYIMCFEASV